MHTRNDKTTEQALIYDENTFHSDPRPCIFVEIESTNRYISHRRFSRTPKQRTRTSKLQLFLLAS